LKDQKGERLDSTKRRALLAALKRPEVGQVDGVRGGQKTAMFRRLDGLA
jgi:hypothetical protein